MAGISDNIERLIRDMLETNGGHVKIVRNELAGRINCVPSQINYVLTTRFTPEQGYFVESKRGGNGGIRITKCRTGTGSEFIRNLIEASGERLSESKAEMLMTALVKNGLISVGESRLVRSSFSDKALVRLDPMDRQVIRSNIFKQVLSCLLAEREI